MRKINRSPMSLLASRGRKNLRPYRFRGDFLWTDKDTGLKKHSVITVGMDKEDEVLAKKLLEAQFIKHFGDRVSDKGFVTLVNRIRAHLGDYCQYPSLKPKLSDHASSNPSQ